MKRILFPAISTIFNLKRTCPKCKKGQIIPTSKIRKTVVCKFCKEDIPPDSKYK